MNIKRRKEKPVCNNTCQFTKADPGLNMMVESKVEVISEELSVPLMKKVVSADHD